MNKMRRLQDRNVYKNNRDDGDCSSSASVGSSSTCTSEESWDQNSSLGRVVQEDDRRRAFLKSMSSPNLALQQCISNPYNIATNAVDEEEKKKDESTTDETAPSTVYDMVTMLQRKTQETKEKSRTVKRRSSFNGFFTGFQGTSTQPTSVATIHSANSLQMLGTNNNAGGGTATAAQTLSIKRQVAQRRHSIQGAVSSSIRMMNTIVDDVLVGRNEGDVVVDFPKSRRETNDDNNDGQYSSARLGTHNVNLSHHHHNYQQTDNHHQDNDGDDNESNCAQYGGVLGSNEISITTSRCAGSTPLTSSSHSKSNLNGGSTPTSSAHSKTIFLWKQQQQASPAFVEEKEETDSDRVASIEAMHEQELRKKNLQITQQQHKITTLEKKVRVQSCTIKNLHQTNDTLMEEIKDLNAKLAVFRAQQQHHQ